jgi:hypothetical protein
MSVNTGASWQPVKRAFVFANGNWHIFYGKPEDNIFFMSTDGYTITGGGSPTTLTGTWIYQGVGDVNADGRADILIRDTATGQFYIYIIDSTGYTVDAPASGSPLTLADMNWTIQGMGDFNGDGKADMLLRHATTGDGRIYFLSGASAATGGTPFAMAPAIKTTKGIGNFKGTGALGIFVRED